MGELAIWLWIIATLVWLDRKIKRQAAIAVRQRGAESRTEAEDFE